MNARAAMGCLVVLTSCGGVPGAEVQWANEGELCIDDAPPPVSDTAVSSPTAATADTGAQGIVSFDAGDTVSLTVTFGGCDCGEETIAACSATREGNVWTVNSEATSYTGCEPCEPVVATCEVGVLASGSYTFEHGGDLLVVDVPGQIAEPCVGETTKGERQ